jgi:hypothetical protein
MCIRDCDYAVTGAWEFNQYCKPNWGYDYIHESKEFRCDQSEVLKFFTLGRYGNGQELKDLYEILSYCCPARSPALGCTEMTLWPEIINKNINLKTKCGFTKHARDHSAQFNSSFIKRRVFWKILAETLSVKYEKGE